VPLHILGNDRYAQFVPQHSALAALEDGALARRVAKADASPDSAAEAELYRRLGPRVRLYRMRHLRDPNAAADLMQQVLLMMLERLREGRLREPERIASFVLGTCRMTVLETWGDAAQAFDAPEFMFRGFGRRCRDPNMQLPTARLRA
jgi:hypothetical protein